MSRIWFSSDFHLYHGNIIRYCDRPFSGVEEMNETIIRNVNDRVKPEDTLYFLGDFCFRNSAGGKVGEGLPIKAEDVVKKFNCRMVFIGGNHDRNNSLKTPIEKLVIRHGGYRINLVHNPYFADYKYEINLVGHVHNQWRIKEFKKEGKVTHCINVGVDVHNFRPVSWEEIHSEYIKWKKNQKL